jgi:hypothetical protein
MTSYDERLDEIERRLREMKRRGTAEVGTYEELLTQLFLAAEDGRHDVVLALLRAHANGGLPAVMDSLPNQN